MLSLHNKKNMTWAKFKILIFLLEVLWTYDLYCISNCACFLVFLPYRKGKIAYNCSYQQTIPMNARVHVSATLFLKYSTTHFARVVLTLLSPDSWLLSQGPLVILSLVFALFTVSLSDNLTYMLFAFCYRLKLLYESRPHTSPWRRTWLIPYSTKYTAT